MKHREPRIVIYRAYQPGHPTVSGWAGFVETDVCVHLGWWPTHLAACRAARRTARRKATW